MAIRINGTPSPAGTITVFDVAWLFRRINEWPPASDEVKALRGALYERQRPGGCKPLPMSQAVLTGNRSRRVSRIGYMPTKKVARRP